MRGRVVVALGGNALSRPGGTGEWAESVELMRRAVRPLAELVAGGTELILTHGNGPQVGRILRQNELGEREVPPLPLDAIGAESQGELGYLIAQELTTALIEAGSPRPVVSMLTRMVIDRNDPSFDRPTKPVGQYYSESEARLLRKNRGWRMMNDPARGGWRRVVPSPRPRRWVEGPAVRDWIRSGGAKRCVPVLGGGGGVPVVPRPRGGFEGVEGVIDKDRAAALIGKVLGARSLAFVTDVPAVAIGFGTRREEWVRSLSLRAARRALREGEFGEGTMAPKVEAAVDFLDSGGRVAVIADAPSLPRALDGEAGTRITPEAAPRRTRR